MCSLSLLRAVAASAYLQGGGKTANIMLCGGCSSGLAGVGPLKMLMGGFWELVGLNSFKI